MFRNVLLTNDAVHGVICLTIDVYWEISTVISRRIEFSDQHFKLNGQRDRIELMDMSEELHSNPSIQVAARTLIANGYLLISAERKPGYALILAQKSDVFGSTLNYTLMIGEGGISSDQIDAASIVADNFNSRLVIIGVCRDSKDAITWDKFIELLGGPITHILPFDPSFNDHLIELGNNHLPDGLNGKPDTLFEYYARAGLEFVFGARVVSYGQDRLFERRPDGVVLPTQNFYALYDTKAAEHGFEIGADDMRRFGSYVEHFNKYYRQYLGDMTCFIVLSTSYKQAEDSLEERKKEMIASYHVPLSFLKSEELCKMMDIIRKNPMLRHSVSWARIFQDTIVSHSRVAQEIEDINKDKIIEG